MSKNKQFFYLLFFTFFPFLAAFGQGWERAFGGPEADLGLAVIESSNGYFLVAGSKGDSTVVLKTNAWGELLWEKVYAEKGSGHAIVETADGNFVIAGNKRADYFLFQINPEGQLIWEKTLGGSAVEQANGLALTADGGFILTGSSTSGPLDSTQMVLLKTDQIGNLEWEKSYGGDLEDFGNEVKVTADQGYIVGGISNSSGNYSAYVVKTDKSGEVEWEFTRLSSGGGELDNIQITSDGGYAFVHSYKVGTPPDNFSDDVFLVKLDADGNFEWERNYGELLVDELGFSLTQTTDGGFAIGGMADGDLLLLKTDQQGNQQWEKRYGGAFTDIGIAVKNSSDGGFLLTGRTGAFSNPNSWEIYLVKTDQLGNTLVNFIEGQVWNDETQNCNLDGTETGLDNWIIQATNAQHTFSGTSDENGHYLIPVDSGTYTVEIFPPNNYWAACQNPILTPKLIHYDTATLNFPMQAVVDCPNLTVDISSPFLRRCFDNIYHVQYCNWGTTIAADAYIEITFDDFLLVNSSSLPWVDKNGQTYTFDIGDVEWGTCGSFQINTTLNCDSTVLGQTHCVEAHIYPDSLCEPINPKWDRSNIIVSGVCDVDSVRFEIKNIGTGDVSKSLDYIIVEDHIILRTGKHQLPSGESKAIAFAANGPTYRLETMQSVGHPIGNRPSATIEGCNVNGPGSSSIGFFNQYSLDDLAPFLSIDCQENIGSFDPNDKQGFPLGYGEKHFIGANTDLEYLIRFQNTGTDTAFRVVVADTLSPFLDPRTIVPGASSHSYNFDLLDNRTLRFTFDKILLPDSTTNEPASHGFIKFRIQQLPNNFEGTSIDNQAAIYFDFNAPVITNKTSHLVGDCFIEGCFITPTSSPEANTSLVSIAPNPFQRQTNFMLHQDPEKEIQFYVYDLRGRLLRQEAFRGKQFTFQRDNLPDGIYLYRMTVGGEAWSGGKIVLTQKN